uniref:Glycosyltransferase n=1 Tax=Pithovirus LCPAC403 TaxID=2506596 RepID=A0A481ZBT3_9VIRU|nr:MAG: glycosyltransferase [Pithovirus LCPAC403]
MKNAVIIIICLIILFLIVYVIVWYAKFKPTSQVFDPVTRDTRIVVSFTTIPSRIKNIPRLIKQLEHQTLIPDAIYFNLPYRSLREGKEYPKFKLPDTFLNVIVNRCDDVGPLTKILPTLEKETNPETIIITIDDDIIYKRNIFEKLVEASLGSDHTAYSFSGWQYQHWTGFGKEGSNMLPFYTYQGVTDIVHGVSGVAYKRKFFGEDFHPIDECFLVDDVLISTYLSLHNITMIKLLYPWYERQISSEITLKALNHRNWPHEKCREICSEVWPRDERIKLKG